MKRTDVAPQYLTENLKLIRSLTGLSQHDFGLKFGLTKDQVTSYERGIAKPSKPTMMKLAELAGISEDQLTHSKISQDQIVKEMFVVATHVGGGNSDRLEEKYKDIIEQLKKVVEAQQKVIENQNAMMTKLLAQN